MSNKGMHQTPATRAKQSIAQRKHTNNEQILFAKEYIDQLKSNPKQAPNRAGLALALNLTTSNLLEATTYNPELQFYIDQVSTLQENYLIVNGLEGKTQPAITALLLKSKHGYIENPANLTQNNYMNISPDVLRLALEQMKKPATR